MLPPELLVLAQICTKSFVGWGFAPDPTGGAYSAPPDPLAGLRGPTSKGRGGEEEGEGGDREGEKGGEGRDLEVPPPSQLCGSAYTRGSAVLSKSTAAPTKGWAGAVLAPSKSAPQCSRNVFQNSKKNALLTCQKTLSKFQNDYSAEVYQIDSLHSAL